MSNNWVLARGINPLRMALLKQKELKKIHVITSINCIDEFMGKITSREKIAQDERFKIGAVYGLSLDVRYGEKTIGKSTLFCILKTQ